MNYDSVMLDAFADELNKLASVRAYEEEIEKLAELEIVAQQISAEYGITKEAAYEVMKEAGIGRALAAGARAVGKGLKSLRPSSMKMTSATKALRGQGAGLKPQSAFRRQSPMQMRAAAVTRQRGMAGAATKRPMAGRAGNMVARARSGGNVGVGRMF